jgi:hypothetical protein
LNDDCWRAGALVTRVNSLGVPSWHSALQLDLPAS